MWLRILISFFVRQKNLTCCNELVFELFYSIEIVVSAFAATQEWANACVASIASMIESIAAGKEQAQAQAQEQAQALM